MLDVLIIGCGNIAGGFDAARHGTSKPFTHAGAYHAHGGYHIAACVEPDEGRRTAFQQHWGVTQAFANIEEAYENRSRYDVISICSPTFRHADDLRTALALKPALVFCEKPMTASIEESLDLARRYREAGIPLMVNYTRRWDERVRMLAAELSRGEWGHIRAASGIYNKGLYNNGSHMLDLLTLLLGPMKVVAAGAGNADMWEDDPSIPAILLSDSGVPITLNCGHAADYSLFELELVTERGTVKMENGGLNWQTRLAGPSPTFSGYKALGEPQHQVGTLGGAALAAVYEIASILAAGGQPSCTADEAVTVQDLCEAIRAASIQNS
jgi:predicted dehydrogenase